MISRSNILKIFIIIAYFKLANAQIVKLNDKYHLYELEIERVTF